MESPGPRRVMSPRIRWNEPRVLESSDNHLSSDGSWTQAAPAESLAETRHGLITCTTYPWTSRRSANELRLRS